MNTPRNNVPLSPKKYLPKKIGIAFKKIQIEKKITKLLGLTFKNTKLSNHKIAIILETPFIPSVKLKVLTRIIKQIIVKYKLWFFNK